MMTRAKYRDRANEQLKVIHDFPIGTGVMNTTDYTYPVGVVLGYSNGYLNGTEEVTLLNVQYLNGERVTLKHDCCVKYQPEAVDYSAECYKILSKPVSQLKPIPPHNRIVSNNILDCNW